MSQLLSNTPYPKLSNECSTIWSSKRKKRERTYFFQPPFSFFIIGVPLWFLVPSMESAPHRPLKWVLFLLPHPMEPEVKLGGLQAPHNHVTWLFPPSLPLLKLALSVSLCHLLYHLVAVISLPHGLPHSLKMKSRSHWLTLFFSFTTHLFSLAGLHLLYPVPCHPPPWPTSTHHCC